MQRKLFYVLLSILTLLTSCKEEIDVLSPLESGNEIANVQAEIGSGMTTRAPQPTTNVDYIGRDKFVENDEMVLTQLHRTTKPLSNFTYTNIHYTSNSNRAWSRDTELSDFDSHERIYWSDNKNGHTFIGYSVPQAWSSVDGKWVPNGSEFTGQFSFTEENGQKVVDFSAIVGDFVDEMVKNANGEFVATGNRVDSIGTNLKKEDLLLTYNTEQKADATGLNTVIYYRHALASLRVIIDIQGFSPSSTALDTRTKVSNLVVKNQPWKYKWTQTPQNGAHGIAIPGWGVDNNTEAGDGVDIKTWQPRPAGEGTGQAKKFTFYSLIVPGKQTDLTLGFQVEYPMYLNPSETQTKQYSTKVPAIDFLPGYTTTILLSLNHEGEPVYIGAEYIDWENVETPDRSELQKISIFLDTSVTTDDSGKTIVSIAKDDVATKDDATWLYYLNGDKTSENNVRDIYGHTGTPTDPFIIKTARQLLSFAYEVKSGRTFNGQYIKLDSDIYLQPTTSSSDITWPGVGDDAKNSEGKYIHAFEGVFLGDSRYIHNLQGQPFFNVIGDYAVVDKVNFDKVINVVGTGVVANVNNGLIAGCNVEGNVNQAAPTGSGDSYCGSIVGDNKSFIVACTHIGDVAGYGYVGGLVGRNAGALVACYHAGLVAYGADATEAQKKGLGGSTGLKDPVKSIVFSCYQNGDLIAHDPNLLKYRAAWPLTTLQMQSDDFVNSPDEDIFDAETNNPSVMPQDDTYTPYIADADKHYSLNRALQEFSQWVQTKANTNAPVQLPCHTFTAAQVQTLNGLFSKTANGELVPAHLYKYSPGTYPRIQ